MEKKRQLAFLEDNKGIVKSKDKIGHLYILTDEEIKEGDWYYNHKEYYKGCYRRTPETDDKSYLDFKKIIATTDESLVSEYCCVKREGLIAMNAACRERNRCLLPKPSPSFIEKFVEEYNKGNVITEVMVEYDYRVKSGTIDEHKKGLAGYEYFELKVNPKDNTITIRKVKDSFTKMDFMNALHKAELVHGKDYSKIWEIIEQNL